ncbi:ead/Ea22-like family protein [Klebsiella oxytoca]|uniref:ead/Ea22-like family protein n=1 Tax=Klebsiella oxytoca TaxID=571 RepID=UPI001CCDC4D7|nr:ead/Ea22-like family protein [Klebsiella oxytoca]MBZ7640517.1 ead/Ea22-like family protein [Klebsiella oxytoca]
MTTDITELAHSLKAAIKETTPGEWYVDYDFDVCTEGYGFIAETHGNNLVHNAQFIALANPQNILALVEALEKAQETIAFQQGEIKALLSSLESRTVKLPKRKMLEDYLAEVAIEERKQILVGVKLEFHRACVAAGIKWEAE